MRREILLYVLFGGTYRWGYKVYLFLFHMGWWRFGKVRVIIHLYFQGFLQGVDNGSVLIVKASLVWGV